MKTIYTQAAKSRNLYHSSKTSGITVLKPKAHELVDDKKVVFATPDPKFAVSMAYGSDGEIAVGYYEDAKTRKKTFYVDELVKDGFKSLDRSCFLYTVSDETFEKDDNLMVEELISHSPVDVIKEEKIDSAYDYLKKSSAVLISYNDVLDDLDCRGRNCNLNKMPSD